MEPASVITDIPDTDAAAREVEPADASASETSPVDDRRWHEILVSFLDDPRGCVQAATDLIEDDLSAFAAFLSRRRESLLNDDGARIEQMRQVVVTYRDISRQLAAGTRAVS
jgi:hypothetical protein